MSYYPIKAKMGEVVAYMPPANQPGVVSSVWADGIASVHWQMACQCHSHSLMFGTYGPHQCVGEGHMSAVWFLQGSQKLLGILDGFGGSQQGGRKSAWAE